MKLSEYPVILICSILLLAGAGLLFMFNNTPPSTAIMKCSGLYNVVAENKTLTSVINFTFADGTGAALLQGVVKDKAGNANEISLSELFNFYVINKSYVLTSARNHGKRLNLRAGPL